MPDRRSFLKTAGLAALAVGTGAAASACSSSSAESGTAAATSVPIANIPVGSGVILSEGKYVVTQPTEGTFKAFSKTCPHQGCPVTKIDSAQITCTCHNTHFSLTDGSVISGPSEKGLKEFTATVKGDQVEVS